VGWAALPLPWLIFTLLTHPLGRDFLPLTPAVFLAHAGRLAYIVPTFALQMLDLSTWSMLWVLLVALLALSLRRLGAPGYGLLLLLLAQLGAYALAFVFSDWQPYTAHVQTSLSRLLAQAAPLALLLLVECAATLSSVRSATGQTRQARAGSGGWLMSPEKSAARGRFGTTDWERGQDARPDPAGEPPALPVLSHAYEKSAAPHGERGQDARLVRSSGWSGPPTCAAATEAGKMPVLPVGRIRAAAAEAGGPPALPVGRAEAGGPPALPVGRMETGGLAALPDTSPVRSRSWLPAGTGYVLLWAVGMRLALSAMAAWVLSLRPPLLTPVIRAQYLGQAPLHDALLAPWQRFDALWYTAIAAHGYHAQDGSSVYFPLYPLLIRLAAPLLGGNGLLAALAVSNVCFAGLLLLLYRLVEGRHGEGAARRTVLLLCVFPTASFLLGAYTESSFLLLTVGCFVALDRERPLLAGVLAFLAALTRIQGAVLALPLLWVALQGWRAGRRDLRPWLAALLPLLATGLFTLYARLALHSGLATETLAQHWNMSINPPWVTLGNAWSALAARHWRIFSYPTGNWVDLLNIVLALGALALVLPARRLLGTPLWLYALVTWTVTLSLHQSTARYMLTVFPALIVLAVWARGRRLERIALLLGAPLMLFVAAEFVLWSFVG